MSFREHRQRKSAQRLADRIVAWAARRRMPSGITGEALFARYTRAMESQHRKRRGGLPRSIERLARRAG